MLAIKNNIMAVNAARYLGKSYDSLAKSVERLASGLRINSAKDDAAGMAVRELIRADVAVLQQGSRNASDGISMLQTMEGAMGVIDDNLIRMKELAEQAATGSYSDDQRGIMNSEFAEMAAEIDRIAGATAFNGITMLDSSTGSVEIHVGTTETISVDNADMTTSGLDIETGNGQWDVTSAVATGVTSVTDDSFLTVKKTAGGSDAVIQITFGSEEVIDVTFASGTTAVGYSVTDVVTAINEASNNPATMYDGSGNTLGYSAAEAVELHDGTYGIKLTAQSTDTASMTMTLETVGGAAINEITGVFGTTEAADTDLMGEVLWERYTTSTSSWDDDGTGGAGAGLNILTSAAAVSALDTITTAITVKDEARAGFGYKMNRLESTIAILDIQSENLMAAESRISDVDVATEMAALTKTQVLAQAGVAMLAQANSMPQMALTLLR